MSTPTLFDSAPATDLAPLLDIDVVGTPRPKGSMRHVGHGRMIEQLKGSPDWRRAVVTDAHQAVACGCGEPACTELRPGFPSPLPVAARIELRFAPVKTVPKLLRLRLLLPASRSTGDVDKQARNVLDAIVDAGVLKDDSQVVALTVTKRYCLDGETPGARITVAPVGEIVAGKAVALDSRSAA